MIANYLKVLWRNVTRHKLYSTINLVGLTAGMSFTLLIGVFVWSETQVNQSLRDVDRLYFLESVYKNDEGHPWFTPSALTPQAKEKYPHIVESYYRFADRNITISKGDTHLRIQSMIGDSTFLETFGFKVLHGDMATSLSRPYSIVITEKTAQQFFGRSDVTGEPLVVALEGNGKKDFVVTAVIETPEKKNSVTDFVNMDAQAFLPLSNMSDFSLGTLNNNDWTQDILTYVKLQPAVTMAQGTEVLNQLFKKAAPAAVSDVRVIEMKPLEDYYLMTNKGAVQKLIVTLNVVAVFILLLAIANFVNITIGGSFSRLKEIGMRKVIGGLKREVWLQFLSESVVFALVSGLFSLVIYQSLRGYAGTMLDTVMPSVSEFSLTSWIAVIALVIVVGVVAGAYPAWYLSRSHTIDSLKGKSGSVKGTVTLSRGLVAIQFIISIFILTGTLVMSRQVGYFLTKDLGYDHSSLLVVFSAPRLWTPDGYSRMIAAKEELRRSPAIASVSLSMGSPTANFSMGSILIYTSHKTPADGISATGSATDEDFLDVYRMTMKEGRYFSAAGDVPNSIVINETAQKKLGVEVGDKLKFGFPPDIAHTIIGVIKDFNTESLHSEVTPVVIEHIRDALIFRHYSIKLQPGNLSTAVAAVERQWRKVFPDDAFQYAFGDDRIAMLYKTELQMNKAANLATVLMLVIVLTGVLGLVALNIARRTKEIGIRKVLGASFQSILTLLSREYIVIICAAFIIAGPLSYWFAKQWLNSFVDHIDLSLWIFALPGLSLLGITVLVVCMKGGSTALSNPVDSIRHE